MKRGVKMKRKDYTGQRFGKLVVNEMLYGYRNNQTYVKCLCDCGNETIVYVGNVVKGATKSCRCLEIESRFNRENHEKDLSGKQFGHLTAIRKTDKRYKNGSVGWLCKCDCGNEVIVRSGNLLRNHTRSCGCNKRSQYEEFIEMYLQERSILYKCEYRFEDCRNHFPLPFDFYIKNHCGKSYCIEFQGQHHYEAINGWGGIEKYKNILINDKIKKEYCKNNNIVLICLPYTMSKQEIANTLDNILEPVTTTAA